MCETKIDLSPFDARVSDCHFLARDKARGATPLIGSVWQLSKKLGTGGTAQAREIGLHRDRTAPGHGDQYRLRYDGRTIAVPRIGTVYRTEAIFNTA